MVSKRDGSVEQWVIEQIFAANAVKTDSNANVTTDQKTKYFDDDSSDFSSELEEVYEQFSKWLEDPIIKENVDKLDPRDEAVLNFASSLLKRTLSESFVGVPLTDGCISSTCKFCIIKNSLMHRKQSALFYYSEQVFRLKRIRCRIIRISRKTDKS